MILLLGVASPAAGLVTAPPPVQEAPARPPDAIDSRRVAEWRWLFARTDRDRDGWISFREANAVLGLDLAEFRRYDADRNGGVTLAELLGRMRGITQLGGVPPGPRPPPPAAPLRPSPLPYLLDPLDPEAKGEIEAAFVFGAFRPAFARTAWQALRRFDADGDEALQASEVVALGFEAALTGAPPPPPRIDASIPAILASVDADGDGSLSQEEIAEHPIARRALGLLPRFDLDGDGLLDAGELEALWRAATRAPAQSP